MDIRKIPRPFRKLKEVNDRINVFIEVTSLDFGWMVGWRVSTAVGRRFKLTADKAYKVFVIFERIGYWSMKLLLNFAVTAPISIPLSLTIKSADIILLRRPPSRILLGLEPLYDPPA
jgi:hypothetical protein